MRGPIAAAPKVFHRPKLKLHSEDDLVNRIPMLAQVGGGCGVDILQGPLERTGAIGPMVSVYFRDPDLTDRSVNVRDWITGLRQASSRKEYSRKTGHSRKTGPVQLSTFSCRYLPVLRS